MGFFGFGKKEKDKIKTGLEKTRTGFWGSIMNTLTGSVIDDEMYDDLEEKLILADASKAELVCNHKGIHRIVLGKLRVGFLEILDLLGVEYMDFSVELAQTAVLPKGVHQIVPVDRGGFHTNHHIIQSQLCECRHDLL